MPKPEGRFLITGAQGFLGAWVVKYLAEAGHQPCVLDISTEPKRMANLLDKDQLDRVKFIQGDVTCAEDVNGAVAENAIDRIIHLAALQVPFCAADPPLGGWVNVVGTLNIFEAARLHAKGLKSLVYASSAAVFGPEEFYEGKRVPEGADLLPGTHYGVFKQCNEGNARVYFQTHDISSVGLRPWALYGVGRDQGITSGLTKAIKAAVVGKPYTIKFTGGIDLQYAEDCARIFLSCSESPRKGALIYTVRGIAMQVNEFIQRLEQVYPKAKGLIQAEGPRMPIAYELDDSLLVKDLDEVPRTPLEEGISRTVEIFERLRNEGHLDVSDLEV